MPNTLVPFITLDVSVEIVWAIGFLLMATTAIAMLVNGRWRKWFSVWIYLAVGSIASASLALILICLPDTDHRASIYFYTYWIKNGVLEFIQLAILWQVIDAIAGYSRKAKKSLLSGFAIAILASLSASLVALRLSPAPMYEEITQSVIQIEKWVSLAWCLVFLCVALSSSTAGIRWKKEVLTVASGFAVISVISMGSAWMVRESGVFSWDHVFSTANSLSIPMLIVWAFLFIPPVRRQEMPAVGSALLSEAITEVESLFIARTAQP